MKKISNIIVLGLCLAAFFTSCVKEENYVREIAELNVNLTPIEENGSVVQGDAITDAMIWAFQCTIDDTTGAPTIGNDAKAVGARYVYGLNTYGNISVHVPLPICNGSRDYLLVAVINTQAYGDFSLTSESTWGAIKAATFGNGGAFWSQYPNDEGKTPEVMPISNWTTFTITSDNTHDDNCYQLNLPVYRTVSKAQFLVAKATNDFDLDILDVKVVANRGYSTGALLTANPETADGDNSEKIQRGKPDAAATTWWWASPTAVPTTNTPAEGETVAEGEGETESETTTPPAITYQLKNSDSGFSVVNNIATVVPVANHNEIGNATYTWIGSTFLFENDNDAPYGDLGCFDEAQGDGYNLYVKYTVDGQEQEVYTPLGKVVRNHDYQVRALVEAGGKLSLSLAVNEWKEEEQELNYLNEVSIGSVTWNPAASDRTITLGSGAGVSATCEFELPTPKNGKWRVELITTSGKEGAFEVASVGSSSYGQSAEGLISAENTKFTIRTTASNFNAPAVNAAKVRLIAETNIGNTNTKRTYEVKNFDYTIVQSR